MEVTFMGSLYSFSGQETRTAEIQMCSFCPATFAMEAETSGRVAEQLQAVTSSTAGTH